MTRQSNVSSSTATDTCLAKLAEFFPGAIPVRIPVQVARIGRDGADSAENTIIEFGTADTVLFASGTPLDFEDRVRLANSDGSLAAEAEVVALQFHRGEMAVAARFLGKVANWIIKA